MISIIVPIYNVEKYLVACVDSILNSTYRDIEVILVDDGATDNSGAICDQSATRDERIKVVHKVNGGLSDARNAGMKVATGDYILFVDGDDIIHCQMVEVLKAAIDSGDYDLSMVYGIRVIEDDINRINSSKVDTTLLKRAEKQVFSGADFFYNICVPKYQFEVAWNKLYKKSLIEEMQFKNLISEDIEWNTRVSMRLKMAILVKTELYYYIQRQGSIMNSGITKKTIERIKTFKCCLDDVPKDNRVYRDKMLKLLYSKMLLIRQNCMKTEYQKESESVCAEIYKDTIEELKHCNNSWLSKMRSIVGYHYPGLFRLTTRILDRVVFSFYKITGRL